MEITRLQDLLGLQSYTSNSFLVSALTLCRNDNLNYDQACVFDLNLAAHINQHHGAIHSLNTSQDTTVT